MISNLQSQIGRGLNYTVWHLWLVRESSPLQVIVLYQFAGTRHREALFKQAEQQEVWLQEQIETLKLSEARLKKVNVQVKGHLRKFSPRILERDVIEIQSTNIPNGTIFPSGNEDGHCVGGEQPLAKGSIAAVVSITFNRANYLRRHIDSLLAVHGLDPGNRQIPVNTSNPVKTYLIPRADLQTFLVHPEFFLLDQQKFPLYISQDGREPNAKVADLAQGLVGRGVSYLHHQEEQPPEPVIDARENLAYYRIANHYKYLLQTFFDCFGYSRLIILEDDMELAPDFFSYFEATSSLLDTDKDLFCISSWNDHGQAQFVRSDTQLYRSDFFPGLGWMLQKNTWHDIRGTWPRAYWDDWLRLNSTRKGKQCIRPEICRTYNFGAKGSSMGQYYRRFLAPIRLSTNPIDWQRQDIRYLTKERYDTELQAALSKAQKASTIDEVKDMVGDVNIMYRSQEHYETLTERLGILREWKDGVPRGGYQGVVIVHWEKVRLLFSQSPDFIPPAKTSATVKVDQSGAVIRRKTKRGAIQN